MQLGLNPDNPAPRNETAADPAFAPVFRAVENLKLSAARALESLWPAASGTPQREADHRRAFEPCRDFRTELDFLRYALQGGPLTPRNVLLSDLASRGLKEIPARPESTPVHLLRLLLKSYSDTLLRLDGCDAPAADRYPVPADAPQMGPRGFGRQDEDRLRGFIRAHGSVSGISLEDLRRRCAATDSPAAAQLFEEQQTGELRAYVLHSSRPRGELFVEDLAACEDRFKYHYLDCAAEHLERRIPQHSRQESFVTLPIPLRHADLIMFFLSRGYFTAGGTRGPSGELEGVLLSKLAGKLA